MIRRGWSSITDEERALIKQRFGLSPSRAATAMGLGTTTYLNLMSEGGTASDATVKRVRELLGTLDPSDQSFDKNA
jgi:hypothetical protein